LVANKREAKAVIIGRGAKKANKAGVFFYYFFFFLFFFAYNYFDLVAIFCAIII